MRKTLMIAIAVAAALATAAVAMAAVFTASGVTAATAALLDGQGLEVRSVSCTGGDGKAFTLTRGRYTGAATSLPGRRPRAARSRSTPAPRTARPTALATSRARSASRSDDPRRLAGRFTGTLKGTAFVGFLTLRRVATMHACSAT